MLPPFHIYALTVDMLLGLRIGAELVLHPRFDVEAVVKDIANKKITVLPGRADDVCRDHQLSRTSRRSIFPR